MKLSFEKVLFGSMIAVAPPAILVVLSLTFWYVFSGNETTAPYAALCALIIGIIIDIIYFKRWFDRRFQLPLFIPMILFVFFNLILYAMFMGFPVLNLLTAPLMGYYVGIRNRQFDLEQSEKEHLQIVIPFASAFMMLSLCILSIFLALGTTVITEEIQHMFNLENEFSITIIIFTMVVGSLALIFLQFLLTSITLIKAMNPNTE